MSDSDAKAAPSAVRDILAHLSKLMRMEVDLARSEVRENLNRAAFGIGLIVAAVVVALTALDVLAAAMVVGLVEMGVTPGWASVGVGGVLGLVAAALIAKGVSDLKRSSITPTRTAESIRRNAHVLREHLND